MTIHDLTAPRWGDPALGGGFVLDPKDPAARVALEIYAAVSDDAELADHLHGAVAGAGGNPTCRWSPVDPQDLDAGDLVRVRWVSIPGRVAGRLVAACGQLWLKPDEQPPLMPVLDADTRLVPGVSEVERLEVPAWWQRVHAHLLGARPAWCPRSSRSTDQVAAA